RCVPFSSPARLMMGLVLRPRSTSPGACGWAREYSWGLPDSFRSRYDARLKVCRKYDGCLFSRGVSGRAGFVSFALRAAAGSRLYLHAFRHRHGAVARRGRSAVRTVFLRGGVCSWLLRGVHCVRRFGQRRWVLPPSEPRASRPDRWCLDSSLWPAPYRRAGQTQSARWGNSWNYSRRAGSCRAASARAAFCRTPRDSLFFSLADWFFWSADGALAQSRRPLAVERRAARHLERLPSGLRLRFWLDPLHRSHPQRGAHSCRQQRDHHSRNPSSRDLFRGAGDSLFAYRSWNRPVHGVLQEFSKVSPRRGTL